MTSESLITPWTMIGSGRVGNTKREPVEFLPDPSPRARHWPIISVDDHIVEPPHMFEGRLPKRLQDAAPRIIEDDNGNQLWHLEGRRIANIGLSAVVGLVDADWTAAPSRFDEMRPGCWDINSRVADMDLAGIYASVCFPSFLPGFAGRVFAKLHDQDLGLALVRAWNDWHIDEWAGTHPGRIIPCQIPWLSDVQIAAEEIRLNAERGFKAVSFTENPVGHGLPSLHTGYWDPFIKACEETGTVICLHGASSGWSAVQAADAPAGEFTTMFIMNAMAAAVDWIWSGIPARFPDVKIVLSESGISWVPAILERIEYVLDHSQRADRASFPNDDLTPAELLHRNLWFSTLYDPAGIQMRDRIGLNNIMLESDYPHSDSTWPDTQPLSYSLLSAIPEHEAYAIACGNAAKLFAHSLPNKW